MTVRDIVEEHLRQHGYDGLFNHHKESAWTDHTKCGCELDDLASCEEPLFECRAGYKSPCDCANNCPWHMGPNVEEK